MAKTRPISPILAQVINFGLGELDRRVIDKLVEDRNYRAILEKSITRLKEVVSALSDADPENKAQIEAILQKYFNEDVSLFVGEELERQIAKISNRDIQAALHHVALPMSDIIRLLSDNVTDDKAQITELWQNWVKDVNTHEIFLDHVFIHLVKRVFPDESSQAFILDLFAEALKQLTDGIGANPAIATNLEKAAADLKT